jgi:uncharacterized protein with PQ loop repeat
MTTYWPTIAGAMATALFALGTLPMLAKAFRSRNLSSYSLGNLLLANRGNLVYSIYVFNLPLGPVWVLHSYYLLSTGLMLAAYLMYQGWPKPLPSSSGQAKRPCLAALCCAPAS